MLRKVMPFLRPFRFRIAFLIGLTAILSVIAMLPPLLTRAIINTVIGDSRRDLLVGIAIFIFAVPVLHAVISFIQVLGIAWVGQRFVLDVRMAVYRHLLTLHMGFFSKNSTGKLINRLMGDSSTMQQILNVASVQIVSDLICSLFAITATLYINWRLAIPILITVVLFVANYNFNIERIKRATRGFRGAEDRLASGVQNRLVANMTVKTFGAEQRENFVFSEHSGAAMDQLRQSWVASADFSLNTMLLQDVGRTIIYFLGCAMVLMDAADYGDVTAFTAYAMQILWPAVRFSQLAEQLQNVRISADRLFEVLDELPLITSKPGAPQLPRVRGQVDFDHVVFSYEPERPVIQGIDVHIRPGETVALVGPTGCGKTTILSLLMRLFDVQEGAIRIDGQDIRDVHLNSLRRQFGIVLQESLLFTVSITDNIRYARPDATQAEVEHAARIAEIHEDIVKLPHGFASVIGDRDVQLSVGQKQRLSIARAVLANPAILIMDEATSSLDSESERAIQVAMERFLHGRTSFIVAHRLSTIRNSNRIILLDKGVICEMGNHETLMAIPNGRYRELYLKHSGKGVISDDEH
jgi:ABC-type multidrug transport system fused ATPase/permease subunit